MYNQCCGEPCQEQEMPLYLVRAFANIYFNNDAKMVLIETVNQNGC